MKKITFHICTMMIMAFLSLGISNLVAEASASVNNDIHFRLGEEETSEPFNFFQDGSFGILHQDGKIYVLPPVNNVDTCDHYVWSGTDINNLYPTVEMNGLTANAHYDRGRIYDAYGWWPFSLWSDNDGTWYSYMHTEDSVQVDTGATGHGSDLRTIALWTSANQGADWNYEGVAVSIDSDYEVPGNLQTEWPRNGGTGDHKLIASPDGNYLYLLYTVFTYDDPSTTSDYCHGNLALARAELDENGVPGPFYKYYNGSFSEPGVGGHETWIMSKTDTVYATDNSQRTVMWNTYLEKYVMVSADRIHHLNISYSDDLIHWTMPERFLQEEDGIPILYANLVSFDSDDQSGGKNVWIYYVTDNYEVKRRILTFDKGENLAYQKTVQASYDNGTLTASSAVDNNNVSGYQGSKGYTSYTDTWLYVDLGQETQFNTIWLTPSINGKGFPTDFSFEGSNDLSSWSTIADYSDYTRPYDDETQEFNVGTQQYRYVRLSVSECSEIGTEEMPFALQINEFKIFNFAEEADTVPAYSANARVYNASSDFSATQGTNHWSYMRQGDLNIGQSYFWSPMSYNTEMDAWERQDLYTYVGSDWMHPDENYQVARIWKAPADGIIHITGTISKKDTSGGDGVQAKILRNREHIWPETDEWQYIAYNDTTGTAVDCTLKVNANEKIFFVLDAYGDSEYDSTYWNPTISFVPLEGEYNSASESASENSRWNYYAKTSSGYEAMTWNASEEAWKYGSTYCNANGQSMHPDSDCDAVRSWSAPADGTIEITNVIKKLDITGGDGVRLKILKNDTQIWPQTGWNTLEYNDATGYTERVATTVQAGDQIYFIVNQNEIASYDTTFWEADIAFAP